MGNKSQNDDSSISYYLGINEDTQLQLTSSRTTHNHLNLGEEGYNSSYQANRKKKQCLRMRQYENKAYQQDEEFSQQDEEISQHGRRWQQRERKLYQQDHEISHVQRRYQCRNKLYQQDEELSQEEQEFSQYGEELSQQDEELSQQDEELSQQDEEFSQQDEELSQQDQEFRHYKQQQQYSQHGSNFHLKQNLLPVDSVSNKRDKDLTDASFTNSRVGSRYLYKNSNFVSSNSKIKIDGSQISSDIYCSDSIESHPSSKLANKTTSSQHHMSPTPKFTEYTTLNKDVNVDPNLSSFSKTSSASNLSGKTLVSLKSVADLRAAVRSQIAMTSLFGKTFKDKKQIEDPKSSAHESTKQVTTAAPAISSPKLEPTDIPICPCDDTIKAKSSTHTLQGNKIPESVQMNKNHSAAATNEITVTCQHTGTSFNFNLSIDEVVNSKVINPLVRKLQRMYLNTLKEEASLIEDLENLPQMVSEVYRTTAAGRSL